jgi:hypothetical protein
MKDIKCPKCNETFKVDQAGYADILKQVRDEEFAIALKEKLEQAERDKKNEILIAQGQKDQEIERLKGDIKSLNGDIKGKDLEKELAVKEALTALEAEKNKEMQLKDDEIANLRDYKQKLSNKMLGESLEQHCEIEFNKIRATGFQRAYFEKDNKVVDGSKGDYIFRDFSDDGVEFVSIMFEMKNESTDTKDKKKNEDFLKELDKDRAAKGCEYAVLVSVLEADNELYNSGIVDVSHIYPKMFVVRPSFFLPILTVLRNAAQSTIASKSELALLKEENMDIANFERDLFDFRNAFNHRFRLAGDRFKEAIEGIDETIEKLEKIKKELLKSERHLELAKNKIEDVSVKSLTRGNPTMAAKFKALPPLDHSTLENYDDPSEDED